MPFTWQSVGFLIFGGVAQGVLFLSLATYSRTAPAQAGALLRLSIQLFNIVSRPRKGKGYVGAFWVTRAVKSR